MTYAILSPPSSIRRRRHSLRLPSRGGFTFAEVLFAVILLGIGFIMLAGMFPVAIQQSQATLADTAAANIAQSAAEYIKAHATTDNMLPTDVLVGTAYEPTFQRLRTLDPALSDIDLWEELKLDTISDTDPRFAWTAIYKRNSGDLFAQVTIFVLQARDYEQYTDADLFGGYNPNDPKSTPKYPSTFEPRLVDVAVMFGDAEPDVAYIYPPRLAAPYAGEWSGYDASGAQLGQNFLAEGAYIVIAFDPTNQTEGSIYQLGRRLDPSEPRATPPGGITNTSGTPIAFELVPGNDLTGRLDQAPYFDRTQNTPNGPAAQAYIVGKGFTSRPDPTNPSATPGLPEPDPSVGRPQDIAVYSTFIPLRDPR